MGRGRGTKKEAQQSGQSIARLLPARVTVFSTANRSSSSPFSHLQLIALEAIALQLTLEIPWVCCANNPWQSMEKNRNFHFQWETIRLDPQSRTYAFRYHHPLVRNSFYV